MDPKRKVMLYHLNQKNLGRILGNDGTDLAATPEHPLNKSHSRHNKNNGFWTRRTPNIFPHLTPKTEEAPTAYRPPAPPELLLPLPCIYI